MAQPLRDLWEGVDNGTEKRKRLRSWPRVGLSRGSADSNTLALCAQAAGARGTSRSPAHASDDFDAFE
jgi:hypothetical protein